MSIPKSHTSSKSQKSKKKTEKSEKKTEKTKKTEKKSVIDEQAFENIINNPGIPSIKNEKITNNNNPNTIEYLDNDIYYLNNKEKISKLNQVPDNTSKIMKYIVIIIFIILGVIISIKFSRKPKENWNILVVYLILTAMIKFKFNINNKFLFFNNINGIDYLFSKRLTKF